MHNKGILFQFPGTAIELMLKFDSELIGGTSGKGPANTEDARDTPLISGLGGSPGEGNGNPLQDSCLENSMDRGTWAPVYRVSKSQTGLAASQSISLIHATLFSSRFPGAFQQYDKPPRSAAHISQFYI